jgi:hypothetical protein
VIEMLAGMPAGVTGPMMHELLTAGDIRPGGLVEDLKPGRFRPARSRSRHSVGGGQAAVIVSWL